MPLLYHEVSVPMDNVPLTVVPIPPIYQGKHLKIICDDPIQRDVYMLTNGSLTGPYRSGQKADSGITFTSRFFGNECLLLCVNKSSMTVHTPIAMNAITAVLPSGMVVDIRLDCQANAIFHVSDPEELIFAYRNSQFTDVTARVRESLIGYVKAALSKTLTKLAFSYPMPLVLSCLQSITATICQAAQMHLNSQLPSLRIDSVWIDLQCTNVSEIMAVINAPKPSLPLDMIPLMQTILSNPALTFEQQTQLINRICEPANKYEAKLLDQTIRNTNLLAPPT